MVTKLTKKEKLAKAAAIKARHQKAADKLAALAASTREVEEARLVHEQTVRDAADLEEALHTEEEDFIMGQASALSQRSWLQRFWDWLK